MMGKIQKNRGFSLIELIVIVAIMIILLAIGIPQLSKYMQKYNVEKEITSLYGDLVNQRFKSMNSGIPHGVRFDSSKQYTIFTFDDKNYNLKFDDTNEEKDASIKTVNYDLQAGGNSISGKVILFDKTGMAKTSSWGLGNFTIDINYPAKYNCLSISSSRIKMGVWNENDHSCQVK
jgi:type II secretory pathway pseudopilin PulG